jgi:hypothetical protein
MIYERNQKRSVLYVLFVTLEQLEIYDATDDLDDNLYFIDFDKLICLEYWLYGTYVRR